MEIANRIDFSYESIDEAFPSVDPQITPLGSRVLLQIRMPKKQTKGGIILVGDTRETEHYNTQVAKVVSTGSLAFHSRNTGEPWPEGAWCVPGDFVRVPRYGGDRWSMPVKGGDADDEVIFVIFNDLDIVAKVTGDPLAIKAFL